MKIALTLVAVAASGLFAAGDRQLQTPTKLPEAHFSTPPVADLPQGSARHRADVGGPRRRLDKNLVESGTSIPASWKPMRRWISRPDLSIASDREDTSADPSR